jgi:hypothetical protein
MWLQLKIGGLEMAVQLLDDIVWDGQALLVGALTQDGPVTCTVPRETIHLCASTPILSAARFSLSGETSFRSWLRF